MRCGLCGGELENGFLLDHTQGGYWNGSWVAGEPEKNRWSGIKVKDRATYAITAYRCTVCGRLELYTPGAEMQLLRPASGADTGDESQLVRPVETNPEL